MMLAYIVSQFKVSFHGHAQCTLTRMVRKVLEEFPNMGNKV